MISYLLLFKFFPYLSICHCIYLHLHEKYFAVCLVAAKSFTSYRVSISLAFSIKQKWYPCIRSSACSIRMIIPFQLHRLKYVLLLVLIISTFSDAFSSPSSYGAQYLSAVRSIKKVSVSEYTESDPKPLKAHHSLKLWGPKTKYVPVSIQHFFFT